MKAGIGAEAEGHRFPYPMTGTRPEINTLGAVGEAKAGMRSDAAAYPFGYPMTSEGVQAGTIPQENTLGIVGENDIQAAQAEDTYARILYKMCGADEI